MEIEQPEDPQTDSNPLPGIPKRALSTFVPAVHSNEAQTRSTPKDQRCRSASLVSIQVSTVPIRVEENSPNSRCSPGYLANAAVQRCMGYTQGFVSFRQDIKHRSQNTFRHFSVHREIPSLQQWKTCFPPGLYRQSIRYR